MTRGYFWCGPHELHSVKDLNDRDWGTDIESVIMGRDALMLFIRSGTFTVGQWHSSHTKGPRAWIHSRWPMTSSRGGVECQSERKTESIHRIVVRAGGQRGGGRARGPR